MAEPVRILPWGVSTDGPEARFMRFREGSTGTRTGVFSAGSVRRLSGITMVLGALYGNTDPAKKTQTYTEVQALAEQYRQRNGGGSIICRELLGLKQAEGTPVASARTPEYYKKRPCPELVRLAADLMAEYIEQHPLGAQE